MRQMQLVLALLLFNAMARGASLPYVPASPLTCRYITTGHTPCAFRPDLADLPTLKYARGVKIKVNNNHACLMRVATTDPNLLANKTKRKVTQYSEQGLFHIWWLEQDISLLMDLDCHSAKPQLFVDQTNPALIQVKGNGHLSDGKALEYPQSYCLTSGKYQITVFGLTDKANPEICQSFDTQLAGEYSITTQQVFIDSEAVLTNLRNKRSGITTDEEPTDAATSSTTAPYSWRDISPTLLPLLVAGVFLSVFINTLLTAHTKCCSR